MTVKMEIQRDGKPVEVEMDMAWKRGECGGWDGPGIRGHWEIQTMTPKLELSGAEMVFAERLADLKADPSP